MSILLLRIVCLILVCTIFEWSTNLIPNEGKGFVGFVLPLAIVGIPVFASIFVLRKDKLLRDQMAENGSALRALLILILSFTTWFLAMYGAAFLLKITRN